MTEKQVKAAPVRAAAWPIVKKCSNTGVPQLDATIESMPNLQALPPAPAPGAPKRVRGVPADPQKFAVQVRKSHIDGQGAFAAEPIPARRKIGEIRGEAISVKEARRRAKGVARIMIVELSERRAIDASQSTDPLRFTNHSCQPNAVLRIRQGRVEFYAMRDVRVGEELTVNYGETHHEGKLRCRCGAAGCVGRI
ncbi:MAG: SET domain-containing protein [Burkholderiaceae bacterium]